jgi:2-polyprenyl-3-methyl-5-hydroxy-6-metoxy-1,4-benzoquinol methylase
VRGGAALKTIVKILGFLGTVVFIPVAWSGLFLLFIVPALAVFALRKVRGRLSWNGAHDWSAEPMPSSGAPTRSGVTAIVFDRRLDVSKLEGCNTRNVQFRWSIFARWVARLVQRRPDATALDFGAGSLRDTYQLATLGLKVDALDLNAEQLREGYGAYQWAQVAHQPDLIAGPIGRIAANAEKYDLIIAFDVIEHLIDLDTNLKTLRGLLKSDGLLFITVPNRRSLIERFFRMFHRRRLSRGIMDSSGVPHVNFHTPAEWVHLFRDYGFSILDRDMAIGFLVNDVWHALFGIPTRVFVDPVIQNCHARLGRAYRPGDFERMLYPKWWMRLVNELDEVLKPICHPLWGWNLFVLGR